MTGVRLRGRPNALINKAIGGRVWDNRGEAARSCRSVRPLTHLVDLTDRQDEMKATRACSVDGCDRPHKGRGFCGFHYDRWSTGLPLEAPSRGYGKTDCDAPGCDRPHRSRGFCKLHYKRFNKHGDPTVVIAKDYRSFAPRGPANIQWKGDAIKYRAAHDRVKRLRGLASTHACVDCGKTALHWSYNNACPRELVSPQGLRYSPDPEQYEPRCTPCHSMFDRRARRSS